MCRGWGEGCLLTSIVPPTTTRMKSPQLNQMRYRSICLLTMPPCERSFLTSSNSLALEDAASPCSSHKGCFSQLL